MILRYIFFFIIGIDALILFSQTTQLSISYNEAKILYGASSFLQYLLKISLNIFGSNDFGLRFVMILFHILSVILMYQISLRYLPSQRNRLWLLLMFVLLPGVVSSAVMVNSAGLIIFGLLLYVYLSEKTSQLFLAFLLLSYALINVGFVYLFLSLAVYHLYKKEKILLLYNLGLYFLSSYIYGFDVVGSPSGHFLDTLGVYSAIFTPILFVYLFYVLYRRFLTNRMDLLWYISTTALLFSLLLSFRQSIPFEHFAPYLIIALPLAAQTFVHSYRVRLKEHRRAYKLAFTLSFAFLILNTLAVFFNKELYVFIENPKKHFAYDFHIARELSEKLKSKKIDCVLTDEKMQLRLQFYGVNKCSYNLIQEKSRQTQEQNNVTISYKKKLLYTSDVTILNN